MFKKEPQILKVSECPMKPFINLIHFTSPKETKPPKNIAKLLNFNQLTLWSVKLVLQTFW